MGIGKGGSPTTTNNSQNQNVASVPNGLAQFQDIYNRANTASQTPYQSYGGQLVAPMTGQQQSGINTINNNAGPITDQQIQNYMNPYQSQVMNALTQNINETNNQQFQQVRGNAISQHALGGDREAVAEAELARQQNLGNAPTLANTLQQGYSQALGAAQQQQQAGLQSGEAQFNVGTVGQQTNQAQNTAAYQQYLQQLAFPYQQAQFLAGIGIPAAGAMGGQQFQTGYANQVMTPPGISVGQGVAGLGLLAGGLGFGAGGFGFGGQNQQAGNGELASGAFDRGGRAEHRYPGGRATDVSNPYAVDPWDIKAVDITGGSPGTPLQTPQNQIKPMQGISITQGGGQQSNPLSDISQGVNAAKGLYGLGKSAAGLFGSGAAASAIPFSDAAALGGIGSDAAAMAGAGAGAGAAVAGEAAADFGLADMLALGMIALKRGGAVYPKHLASGGDAGESALQSLANMAQQSGPLAQMLQSRIMTGGKPVDMASGGNIYPRREEGGDTDDDQPWALESRWPTQGTDTAIPPWKSADPRGDAAALRNYGLTQAPEVSTDTSRAIPMPQSRPSPYVKPDDADLPDASEPQSSPTRVNVQKGTGFDPAAASYQDIMNKDNFKGYAPQHQSLMGLLKNPATRGDALMEMGLRILAAPPTSKSGLSEMAQGALGTMQSYNQFSKDATTAQEKAQELAAKLKGQSNTDDYNDSRIKLEQEKLEALKNYRESTVNQRFQKLAKGNIVMGNYQYPGPTGAVVAAYADKTDGHIYDAHTHEELSGGRWAGTNAVDLGLSKPPGSEPPRPDSVPEGSRWSPSVKMWKDSAGKIYDANGQLVQQ